MTGFGGGFGGFGGGFPSGRGGLGFGTIGSSAVLAVVLVAVILYTMRRDAIAQAAVAFAGNPSPEPS